MSDINQPTPDPSETIDPPQPESAAAPSPAPPGSVEEVSVFLPGTTAAPIGQSTDPTSPARVPPPLTTRLVLLRMVCQKIFLTLRLILRHPR